MTVVQVPMLNSGAAVVAGAGSPIGTIALGAASLYLRTDDGSLWLNPADGNSNWVEIAPNATLTKLSISAAVSKIIPGVTSISIRNHADSADHLYISDAGNIGLGLANAGAGAFQSGTLISLTIPSAATSVFNGLTTYITVPSSGTFGAIVVTALDIEDIQGTGGVVERYRAIKIVGVTKGTVDQVGLEIGAIGGTPSTFNTGILIGSVSGAGTNNYGINIGNVTGTGAFSIKTNLGPVQFGDILTTIASASGHAGFRLPHGAAPSSPVDGDMWTTSTGLFVRINGVTVGPLT